MPVGVTVRGRRNRQRIGVKPGRDPRQSGCCIGFKRSGAQLAYRPHPGFKDCRLDDPCNDCIGQDRRRCHRTDAERSTRIVACRCRSILNHAAKTEPCRAIGAGGFVAPDRRAAGVLQGAATHRHQRDGAAWFTEWMCLPQIVLGAASAARIAGPLCTSIMPNAEQMRQTFTEGLDMIHAEALSFALSAKIPRPRRRTWSNPCA